VTAIAATTHCSPFTIHVLSGTRRQALCPCASRRWRGVSCSIAMIISRSSNGFALALDAISLERANAELLTQDDGALLRLP